MGTEEVQLHSFLTSVLDVCDQIHVPDALTPGGWGCRRVGLDVVEKKLFSCARRDSNAVTSPQPKPYSDYTIPANHQVGLNTPQYSNELPSQPSDQTI
jgi:hypothetical protein